MRTYGRLDDVPLDFSAFPALLRYAKKWWEAESSTDPAFGGSAVWESADLILAIEQAEKAFPAGPDSHTLPLVLRFATIIERVLADHHGRDIDPVQPDADTAVMFEPPMPSWRMGDPREIYGVLINACTSLARTINDKSNESAEVGKKAAIVATYALMLADLNGALGDWPDWQIARAKGSPSAYRPDVS